MRMEINGENSCTGNSCHTYIRYFFIKDRVDREDLRIMYCPTRIILADYFTKPLQGGLFHMFKEIVMGRASLYKLIEDMVSYSRK